MNPSLAILQKIKNQFFQSIQNNKSDFHVAYAPFAFPLTTEDFFFLKDDLKTGNETRQYYSEWCEFSFLANSVLTSPHIWTISKDNLLYDLYQDILNNAQTIDTDFLTFEETKIINDAKKILYDDNSNKTTKYLTYLSYQSIVSNQDKKVLELKSKLNTASSNDKDQLQYDLNQLGNEQKMTLAEWAAIGNKSEIESALASLSTKIKSSSVDFVERWTAEKQAMDPSAALTNNNNQKFWPTTCIPNAIKDPSSNIWTEMKLSKQDITALTQQFINDIPQTIINNFDNVDMELDSISFKFCLIDIVRPWFDNNTEKMLNSNYWKYEDQTEVLSEGDDNMIGKIPAYPVKMLLAKNIEFVLTPNSQKNEEIKSRLKNGEKIFFGTLLLKTIPLNLSNDKVTTFRIQPLTTNELTVFTKVINKNVDSPQIQEKDNKFKVFESFQAQILMNRNSQLVNQEKADFIRKPLIGVDIKPTEFRINPVEAKIKPLGPQINLPETKIKPIHFIVKPIRNLEGQNDIPPDTTETISNITTYYISGKVMDEKNQPIVNAEIQLLNVDNTITQSLLSSDDGSYNFQNITTGSYQVTISKGNFKTNSQKIIINSNKQYDILLESMKIPTESLYVIGVICKKMPKLPRPPIPNAKYI